MIGVKPGQLQGRGAPGLWSVPREGNIIKYDHMYNIAMLQNIFVCISVAWVGDRPSVDAGREARPRSTQP